MKQSKLFGKSIKEIPVGVSTKNHEFLYRGGFIRESVAGRYYFLPLGMRVHDKLVKLIEKEMDKTGAQKIVTPTLHQLELWKETNRTDTAGFELMTVKDRREADFALGGTAEEMIVDLVRKFNISYKDLPFNIYQFSNKFRDEMRARGGLLRVREFVMKDAYSFHADEEDFKREYKLMENTYKNIFEKCGLKTYSVLADNGYIGGEYCHELVVESEIGESDFFVSEDGKYVAHEDVAEFHRGEINPDDEMKEVETIEQPEWVKTMDDNVKHYDLPASRFLKNVVYQNTTNGELIIVVIRGDLEVNKTKLESKLNLVGQLEAATDEDLASIGTKSGWVHSWGHDAKYVGDISLKSVKNFIGGQKEEKTDTINVNYGRDFECEILDDFALAEDRFIKDGQKLIAKKGVEVGNIFQLGHHYSELMNATFKNKEGKDEFYYMGCYGIGVGRTMATIAEIHHDENGIIWPENLAPFKVHLLSLNVNEKTEEIYRQLLDQDVEVLFDDRDVRPG
ncbi:proline--tRNA ligase, partial [Candidatus Babeliales bacterium]|nr:proline--tRNA ligase [Candidatus Babeliales bacterium]